MDFNQIVYVVNNSILWVFGIIKWLFDNPWVSIPLILSIVVGIRLWKHREILIKTLDNETLKMKRGLRDKKNENNKEKNRSREAS